jgi:hypothetical protein
MDRHFETPEQPVAHMREVAVKRSGFSNWLGVEPVKTWEGEPEHTQHDSPAPVLRPPDPCNHERGGVDVRSRPQVDIDG